MFDKKSGIKGAISCPASKREPGVDLLRCLALLFVVIFHSFLNNGYYTEPQRGIFMWLAGSIYWLSTSCIGLFLMLTGYLQCKKTNIKACYRSLVPVLLTYLAAAMITIPIRYFILDEKYSFTAWFTGVFSFRAVNYGWYVEMYIGLVLLMPFVNMVLERLEDTKALLGLGAVMLVMTALPGATHLTIAPDYWSVIYPLTYYILGAIVRRIQPKLSPWLGIAGAIVMSAVLGFVTVLSTDGKYGEAMIWEFPDLWIAFIVVCLFVSFYRIRVPGGMCRILAFGASGCLGGCLLSHLFDAWCYDLLPSWKTPTHYVPVLICITLPIFVISILSGVLLESVAKWPLSRRKEKSHRDKP